MTRAWRLTTDEVEITATDVFFFGATVWNTHRIHFEAAFAASEGYRDVVVQGPFLGCLLMRYLAGQTPGLRIDQLTYRNVAPCVAGERLLFTGAVSSTSQTEGHLTCEMEVRRVDGSLVVNGAARISG